MWKYCEELPGVCLLCLHKKLTSGDAVGLIEDLQRLSYQVFARTEGLSSKFENEGSTVHR